MGNEIDAMEKWPCLLDDFPQANAAVEVARDQGAQGSYLLRELVEGDIAVVHVRWEGGYPGLVSMDANGVIRMISGNDLWDTCEPQHSGY